MATYILVFHFIIAVALIGLILVQQGKGAEAGASEGHFSDGKQIKDPKSDPKTGKQKWHSFATLNEAEAEHAEAAPGDVSSAAEPSPAAATLPTGCRRRGWAAAAGKPEVPAGVPNPKSKAKAKVESKAIHSCLHCLL